MLCGVGQVGNEVICAWRNNVKKQREVICAGAFSRLTFGRFSFVRVRRLVLVAKMVSGGCIGDVDVARCIVDCAFACVSRSSCFRGTDDRLFASERVFRDETGKDTLCCCGDIVASSWNAQAGRQAV